MTTYIPAHDTEQDACLAGVKEIVSVHEAFEIPATFEGHCESARSEFGGLCG